MKDLYGVELRVGTKVINLEDEEEPGKVFTITAIQINRVKLSNGKFVYCNLSERFGRVPLVVQS
jgi:hypothetical protein